MKQQRFARAIATGLAGAALIGATAVVGGTGIAHADPDDATPPIIDDFTVLIPALSLDPRDRDGITRHWPGTGNYCQNRFITCRVGGF